MPIFDFKCENPKCSKYNLVEEKLVRGYVIIKCGMCNQGMKRLVSAATPIFKGTGYYCTDFKK